MERGFGRRGYQTTPHIGEFHFRLWYDIVDVTSDEVDLCFRSSFHSYCKAFPALILTFVPFCSHQMEDRNWFLEKVDFYRIAWSDSYKEYPFISVQFYCYFSLFYLLVIFAGPKIMAGRQPFGMKNIVIFYNLAMSVVNGWVIFASIEAAQGIGLGFFFSAVKEDPSNPWFARYYYVFYIHCVLKTIECADTIIMVLRKKNKQLSFLHCYHHFSMIWLSCFFLRCPFESHVYSEELANSIVHFVMYGYYGFAAAGIRFPYKKIITQLQLVQFTFYIVQSLVNLLGHADIPCMFVPIADVSYTSFMMGLFLSFYFASYGNAKAKRVKAKGEYETSEENVASRTTRRRKKDN
jgi:hypothetical protein